MQNNAIPQIFTTRDYSLFKFYSSNRPAEHWKTIAESIEQRDLTPYNPIIVSKDYYIIDGQNRFMACKSLGKPIFFTVANNADDKDIALLNAKQKNWALQDYLNFYCTHGFVDYIALDKIINETGLKLYWVVNSIWQSGPERGKSTDAFKKGLYKFPKQAQLKCRKVSSVLFTIENTIDSREIKNASSLIAAIASLVSSDVNTNELKDKIKKYPFLFKAQADQVHYKEMLEVIFNYRRREKVSFKYML